MKPPRMVALILLAGLMIASASNVARAGKTSPHAGRVQGVEDAGSHVFLDSAAGVTPVGSSFAISPNAGPGAIGGKPAIAFDGTNFFIVWRDSRNYATNGYDIYGARVAPNGTVLDRTGVPISTFANNDPYPDNMYFPSVAFDGTNYMVVWIESRDSPAYWYDVFAARVTPVGQVLDPQGIQITNTRDGGNLPIRMPSIAFDGTNYLIVWRTGSNNIRGTRVSTTGESMDGPNGFLISGTSSYYPYVAFDGTNYMVVWHDNRNEDTNGWDIYGARVAKSGQVLDPAGICIADDPQNQEHTTIAFDGTNYLVGWYDWRPNNDSIDGSAYAARVSPTGTVLDDPPLKISDYARGQVGPAIAYDGTDYLVAWMVDNVANFRGFDVYGRGISKGGVLLGEKPTPIATAMGHQFSPYVGFGGDRFLVAWNESLNVGRCYDGCIYGQILQKQGSALPARSPKQSGRTSLTDTGRGARQPHAGWVTENSPTAYALLAVWGFNGRDAYAADDNGLFIRYQGTDWVADYNATARQYAIWGSNPDDVWAVGWVWRFHHKSGSSWSDATCGINGVGFGLWGTSASNIFAVGDRGQVCHYDGTGWNLQSTGISTDLWDVWGTSSNDIYAAGEFGTILRYDGVNWTRLLNVPTIQSLNAIWGSSPDDIYVVGDFGTILHYDGSAWTPETSNTSEHLFGVWGLGVSSVYAVGLHGTILHNDGSGWQAESSDTQEHLHSVWGGFDTQDSVYRIWAVGGRWAENGRVILLSKTIPVYPIFLPIVQRNW